MMRAASPLAGAKLPFKVVVVDDSQTARRWIAGMIGQDPRLTVVGMAASAEEARTVIKATNPDVITLDVEMPGVNGMDFLKHIMRLRPMPVVMVASIPGDRAEFATRARRLGAAGCIAKPELPNQHTVETLCECLFRAAGGLPTEPAFPVDAAQSRFAGQILMVGASTGGVNAIETLLQSLPDDTPPIVIAQHMPQKFLMTFVERLDKIGTHSVDFAQEGMRLAPGLIRVAPSGQMQTCVAWHSGAWHVQSTPRRFEHAFCPSVNVLFASGVAWADRVGAIILTGLGNDGAQGMLALRRAGARTIGQSAESCVIHGMPGAALALNATEDTASIENIGPKILSRMMGMTTGLGAL